MNRKTGGLVCEVQTLTQGGLRGCRREAVAYLLVHGHRMYMCQKHRVEFHAARKRHAAMKRKVAKP